MDVESAEAAVLQTIDWSCLSVWSIYIHIYMEVIYIYIHIWNSLHTILRGAGPTARTRPRPHHLHLHLWTWDDHVGNELFVDGGYL